MQPRHLTGQPRDVCSGDRLIQHFLASLSSIVALVLLAGSTAALAAGNIVQYQYDAAGNIVQIQRTSTAPVSITSFSPTSGPIGTAVTINGVGFSATLANNTVTFNGTAASVSSATLTSISTTVPTGATTGRIQVTVAGVTETSSQDFFVTTAGAPTITSFTPTSGASGTSVSVTGTNFVTGATTVKLNGVTASSSTTSTTAMSFTVPGSAASSRISATTSAGTGYSAADFIVPPPFYATTDIVTTLRIAAGSGYTHVSVPAGAKSAVVLFDGTAAGFYSLHFSSFGTSPTASFANYKVVKPDNTVWQSGSLNGGSAKSLLLPALPSTGTYTLVLSPNNATLDTLVRLDADATLTLDGSTVALHEDYPNQSSRFLFSATAGQRIGAGAQSIAFLPTSSGNITLSITDASGNSVASQVCNAGSCDTEFVAASTATYTLIVLPSAPLYATGSVLISSPASGTLTADTPQAVTLSRVGQDAAFTISATSGDSYGLDVSGVAMTPSSNWLTVTILKPDGTQLMSSSSFGGNSYIELGALPTTGNYTVFVDPQGGATGTFRLTAEQGPLVSPNGTPLTISTSNNGQSARFRVSATAGQRLDFGLGALTYSTGSGTATGYGFNDASRTSLASGLCFTSDPGCGFEISSMASTATYAYVFTPPVDRTITGGTLVVSTPLTGTFNVGDPAQTIATSRPEQSARYTFSGTSGQTLHLNWSSVTVSGGWSVSVSVLNPSGGTVSSSSFTNGTSGGMDIAALPSTGTYTIVIAPPKGETISASVSLVTR